ncbi:hypothetical protein K9S39_04200 [Streptomyces halobius]|uniref:Uncharacterized protein n=1 Tax=Streptomyces halobius TaxID=2879846 RepID=A0ABY4MK03_9ACTN|nr:hypothetical protein K9S39_04200 [Streptomyces halobius]
MRQQPAQIHRSPPTLIRTRERLEHIRREILQITPDRSQLLRRHNRSTQQPIIWTRYRQLHLTKPY